MVSNKQQFIGQEFDETHSNIEPPEPLKQVQVPLKTKYLLQWKEFGSSKRSLLDIIRWISVAVWWQDDKCVTTIRICAIVHTVCDQVYAVNNYSKSSKK